MIDGRKVNSKKVSVKHFLNKRLKPRGFAENKYPVYTKISYDRRTTEFNFLGDILKEFGLSSFMELSEIEFERIFLQRENGAVNIILEQLNNNISLILKHEIELRGHTFTIKGISKRLRCYLSHITDIFAPILSKHFGHRLENLLTVRQYKTLYGLSRTTANLKSTIDFLPTYAEVSNKYIGDIHLKIRQDLKHMICAYLQLIHFENYNSIETNRAKVPRKISFIQWISTDISSAYLNFVKDKLNGVEKPYYTTNNPKYDQYVKIMLNKYPPMSNQIPEYKNIIDRLVIKRT